MNKKNDNATKWIAYYRVSTKRQSLGLDAQRARVEAAASTAGATIIAEIEEKESGKDCDRRGLNRAMAIARRESAVIVVAKHDRLTRDLGFACELIFKSGVSFNILNMPVEAMSDALLFGVYYGLATQEAKMISERTKAALAALKAQGVQLGRPDAATSISDDMRAAAAITNHRKADENRNNVAASNEIRRYIAVNGHVTLQSIANHLNDNGYYTSRGVMHTAKSVQLLCHRYGISR